MKTKEELRTLKDLTIDLSKNLGAKKADENFQVAKILELKQEAIKWVKYNNTFQGKDDIDKELEFLNTWIIDFFNLTEKDLK